MDYEKAYKAVLQTANQWIKDGCTDKERICLESVFPELRESEDERIIEGFYTLIRGIRRDGGLTLNKVPLDKCEAWLEKQKESLHISETCKENADSFTDACKDVIVAIEKYLDWLTGYPDYAPKGKYSIRDMLYCLSLLEKQKPENVSATTMIPSCWEMEQKDQKPAERSLEDDHIIGFVYDLLNEIEWKDSWAMSKEECLQRLNNYSPQKPAEWSEDNIKELTEFEAAMLHIGMSFFGGSAGLNPNNTNEVKKQAKLLLELVPKQEWGEKDNIMLENTILCLKEYCLTDEITWLKSLRPQQKEQDVEKYPEDKSFEDEWKNYYNNSLVSRRPMNKREVAKHFYWFVKKNAWRPSEEQMKQLYFAADLDEFGPMVTTRKEFPDLGSLYEQLKKLM